MKIGILGTGDVGKALGRGFILSGENQVCIGSREAGNPKTTNWCQEMGPNATSGSFAQAAKFGEIIVLATLGTANEEVIRRAGPENFKGKIIMDATNPLDFSQGMPPRLVGGLGDSAGEIVQKILPQSHVVKVFNTVGNSLMYLPKFGNNGNDLTPSMFICGENEKAKEKVGMICKDFGWETIDVGGINTSHYLEAMCMVWVLSAIKTNAWNQAYKMLRK